MGVQMLLQVRKSRTLFKVVTLSRWLASTDCAA
jgi:hypothetical protein